jgi:hypothetical protein
MFKKRSYIDLMLCLSADGAGGGGGGDVEDNASGAAAFQKALSAHNSDLNKFSTALFDDNFKLREANRDLRKQVAPAGSVILDGDQLAAWKAYQALGAHTDLVKPDDVKAVRTDLEKARTELQQAQQEAATLKRSVLLRDVADVSGYVYSVLATLDKPDLSYEIVSAKDKDDKPIRVAKVKVGNETKDLSAYAEEQWSVFLPALVPQTQVQNVGTPFIQQSGGSGQTKTTYATAAQSALDQRYKPKKATS